MAYLIRSMNHTYLFLLFNIAFCQVSFAESNQVRLALVIGNSGYSGDFNQLGGARTDAQKLAVTLTDLHFKVTTEKDLDRQQIMTAVQSFKDKLKNAGNGAIGFFYYAGHGGSSDLQIDINGDRESIGNFIAPVDIRLSDIADKSVRVQWIADELEELSSGDNHPIIIMVIDACRTVSSQGNQRNIGIGYADGGKPSISAMKEPANAPPTGFLYAFSTSNNKEASDAGEYAEALSKHLKRKGLTIANVFEEVSIEISALTHQDPIYRPMINSRICLVSCEAETKAVFVPDDPLIKQTHQEAAAGLKRIEALGAPTRCRGGYAAVQQLFASGEKHMQGGNLDTAGKSFETVLQKTGEIQYYLNSEDHLSKSLRQFEDQIKKSEDEIKRSDADSQKKIQELGMGEHFRPNNRSSNRLDAYGDILNTQLRTSVSVPDLCN